MSFLLLCSFLLGNGPFDQVAANSYTRQAVAFLSGHLDLTDGSSLAYLELAIKDGKYYVSFPPFPAFVLLPFAVFCGLSTPDFLIIYISDVLAAAVAFLIAKEHKIAPLYCLIDSLFIILGSNFVFLMLNPSVWFLAQNLCFTMALFSLYFATKGKNALAFLFWAFAVGCRPMQIVFLPVLLFVVYEKYKVKCPEAGFFKMLLKIWKSYIPMAVTAWVYMILNYARFQNPFEFGHNYLPEFVNAPEGQFSLSYVSNNIAFLFHNIEFDETGKMVISHFGNLSMFIVIPVATVFVMFGIISLFGKGQNRKKYCTLFLLTFICASAYLFLVVMHKTMGAWQFGCRYAVDIVPWIYLFVCGCFSKKPELNKWIWPFFIWGSALNLLGTIIVYNNLQG